MIIKNANIYSESHEFRKGSVLIQSDRISSITFGDSCPWTDATILDAQGAYLIPGLVDIHSHGAKNCDICDGSIESLKTISEYEASQGILAICPATMTIPEIELEAVLDVAAEFSKSQTNPSEASFVGINLEGPFISPKKMGAQDADHIIPAKLSVLETLQNCAKGLIKLVDIAPEEAKNLEFIRDLKNSDLANIHVSIAHSNCDYGIAAKAFEFGADHLTHTWNAMNGIHHRNPGPSVAGVDARAYAEIICDGIHIHPAMIRLAFKMFGNDKVCLISDSMRAAGMVDGEYDLGGQQVLVRGNKAVLKADENTIAGSVTNLFECMKKAVGFGIPLEAAIRAASENPARSIGVDADYGSIAEGKFANLVILDENLQIKKIINKGIVL